MLAFKLSSNRKTTYSHLNGLIQYEEEPLAAEGKFAETALALLNLTLEMYLNVIILMSASTLHMNFESSCRYQPVRLPHANTLEQMLANHVHATQ